MVPDRNFTENELIPQNTSSHIPESRLAAQVSRKVSNSALISHKVNSYLPFFNETKEFVCFCIVSEEVYPAQCGLVLY